jgi:hypothetical protein
MPALVRCRQAGMQKTSSSEQELSSAALWKEGLEAASFWLLRSFHVRLPFPWKVRSSTGSSDKRNELIRSVK